MSDAPNPEEFTDIDEAVGADWEAETTPYERVRAVISHTYSAVSAESVADDARTSPKTARKHLNTLANEGFVATESGEHGGTVYRRSPESLVVEQAADILEHVSVDELIERIADMRETLSEFQSEYGVGSPEEVTVAQTNQALAEPDAEATSIRLAELQEWQMTRRNLAFANAALSIANAERFVDDDGRSPR